MERSEQPADVITSCWRRIARAWGWDAAIAEPILAGLLADYAEPARHYHNRAHVASLLALAVQHAAAMDDPEAVELAILFHDAVYDPTRHDNEEESARHAARALLELGMPAPRIRRIACMIEATRHGSGAGAGVEAGDNDLAWLLDLDLSILGQPREAYAAYADAIRREYAQVPEEDYRNGRAAVLEGFVARPHIYLTRTMRGALEAAARENLAWELGRLA